MTENRFPILGTEVQAFCWPDITNLIHHAVVRRERRIILHHNLHSLYVYHHDDKVAALYDTADHVYVDGMSLIFLGRCLGLPLEHRHRTTLLDSFEALAAEAARRNWRVLYLGSKPGVGAKGAGILMKRFPTLTISTLSGYFDARATSRDNKAVIEAINAFQPDLLLVGMGVPRQEHWILENLHLLPPVAIVTAGATMDYITGEISTPPSWAGPLGLYWFFRLLSEPRRLWRRYLIEPWYLLDLFLAQLSSKRPPFTPQGKPSH